MEMMIAILLWLGLIAPDQQFTQSQYEQLIASNASAIELVANNPEQLEQASSCYSDKNTGSLIDSFVVK